MKKNPSVRSKLFGSVAASAGQYYPFLLSAVGGMLATAPHSASAMNLYNGMVSGANNIEINLDTTISYTPIFRVGNPSAVLVSPTKNPNGSEGDLDFQHGLVSNLFEILPVLDIKDGDYGAHFSGEAYINTSFLGTNQNDQPSTLNPFSIAKTNDFTSATRNVDGLNARALDAFVYGSEHLGADGSRELTVKIGRQTLIWGQSLFLTNNGIAAGMAPTDILTANNNPNAETQQVISPVGQVVVSYQVNPVVTLEGYYQFEWQHDYFQGVGSFFSSSDILDKGGQRLIAGPGTFFFRGKDNSPPSSNGQFGGSLQLTLGNYDVGFYGLRYDSKAPEIDLTPSTPVETANGLKVGTYNLVYPRDIWIEGVAGSTTIGPANFGGELSFRQHMPLVTGTNISAGNDTNGNPAYPTGNTMAGQVSIVYASAGLPPIDPGGVTISGEVGFNHVLGVTANSDLVTMSPHRSRTAAQFQTVITPTYYDVLPDLQLTLPIGLAYDFYGRSEIDGTENQGTGSVNFGVTATYRETWIASVTYDDPIGAPNPTLQGEPSTADRSFVLLNFQHTF
jgi:hypothetical protein